MSESSKKRIFDQSLDQIIHMLQGQFQSTIILSQNLDKLINSSYFNYQPPEKPYPSGLLLLNNKVISNSLKEHESKQTNHLGNHEKLSKTQHTLNKSLEQSYSDINNNLSSQSLSQNTKIKKEESENQSDQQTQIENQSHIQDQNQKLISKEKQDGKDKENGYYFSDLKSKEEDSKPTVKKIFKKKKIEKIKKKFCISQNQSFNQDSSQEEISVITKPDIEEDIRYQAENRQKSDQNLINQSFQNFTSYENVNSSEMRNKYFQNSPPIHQKQRQFYDILQSSYYKNRQQDSFQKQFLLSNYQNQYYQSSERTKQMPSPFIAQEYNPPIQKQINNVSYFYTENNLYYQQLLKQYGSMKNLQLFEDQGYSNNAIQNQQMGQVKTENIEDISSQINESFSNNSQQFKKNKKFPSVIYIEGSKKFQCQICKKTFDSKQKLGGHKARSHPDAPCQRTEREEKKKKKIQESEAITPSESNTADGYDQFKSNTNYLKSNPSGLQLKNKNRCLEQYPQMINYLHDSNEKNFHNNNSLQNISRNIFHQQQDTDYYSFQPRHYSYQ
ncbi:C2H2-type zinc-finger protein (macronuclear) [Tetrahymena thermophila SB210]|uniref:C2H2-type zinc-finger protein n=1 Tax=Tetrahymena thermophila (strain SB210) TaxID=312017 RepID=I7M2F1_TETTS|nr:C2H2-type zinc-finger protein [Tetrahymena thermophila SB210]EAS00269.3 C2H2-type zinc-finger protein [Tetrahymena thermophila SB210]|eukprot:XP_001020514.3 C2H2-type zinc-finger protein [Tetrahymena thermophila SB210]